MRDSGRMRGVTARSRGSSTGSGSNPRQKVRDCCRKLVAFMCTQVGVGGLVVGYAILGAMGFMSIEGHVERPEIEKVAQKRNACLGDLWRVTTRENVFNKTAWQLGAAKALKEFQDGVVTEVRAGYDGRVQGDSWSFPAALMFSLSVFTMIGYGNMVPRTTWGKIATVVYAVFGIPLYVLYFMNMGKVLAQTFRWLYTKAYECSMEDRRRDSDSEPARIIVPSTACLWVMGAYVATGTVMFAEWENWNYLDSTYFCVTSLCKIGIGDFVPGANILDSRSGHQTKLVINFVYLLLGMGLMAMCYNLMREVVRVKMRELKSDITFCFEDLRLRAVACYRRNNAD
ncbi:potassium channel subfamily K member 15 [Nilaparvata lugens]|uniref:potassium channel subfamily K member 15 n=1 Tax=Nilaparvata lugens TaxID=108931 RepID=UPI00193DDC97|nr:potassium channel subfamily K member 15 [Nilaparvata lugens]